MSKYIAHLRQSGGCDYTIGCGIEILELSASTMEAAQEELHKIIIGDENEGGYTGDSELTNATIYEVSAAWESPLATWYKEVTQRQLAEARAAQIAEYERLGKKIGLR